MTKVEQEAMRRELAELRDKVRKLEGALDALAKRPAQQPPCLPYHPCQWWQVPPVTHWTIHPCRWWQVPPVTHWTIDQPVNQLQVSYQYQDECAVNQLPDTLVSYQS